MDLFGKWKERAEQAEAINARLENELKGLQAFRDRHKNIADAEETASQIVAAAQKEKAAYFGKVASAKLVLADIENRIQEQEQKAEEHLQALDVLSVRAMLVTELDIDPKIALSATEKEIDAIKSNLAKLTAAEACDVVYNFQYNGSKAEGRKFQNQIKRLAKLAFDGQCKQIIKGVTVKNGRESASKIRDAASKINNFTEMLMVRIVDEYVEQKVDEARVAWKVKQAAAERRAVEREEREILQKERQLERENQQLIKDAEKAVKDKATAEELLAAARLQIQAAHGEELAMLREQLVALESALDEANERNARAQSMAQITRAGHVYVISNRGSFGEDVYKIGMTRRLDPEDRVSELGDASVPFKFDTHAMIWSEDAPALEAELHKSFAAKRLNLVNQRREFFKVSLAEIRKELDARGIEVDLSAVVSADEFRESKRLRKEFYGEIGRRDSAL